MSLETPVVLIIFKRLDTTQRVFDAIREARPKKLLVIADGPRPEKAGEAERCAQTRAIIEQVDWNCEVLKCFSEENLGCGKRIATGLSWVFDQVEDAIILEDDCLPHPSFFAFCSEMLERYRHEPKVMSISGCLFARSPKLESYYFSHYLSCWGWATWRRAWQHFDFGMKELPGLLEQRWLHSYLPSDQDADFWQRRFQNVYASTRNDVWSYQFQFASWRQNALSIRANTNLISNVGLDADATHTIGNEKSQGNNEVQSYEEMIFPLRHPTSIERDIDMDTLMEKEYFREPTLVSRAYRKLSTIFS